jgi:hypothetical protein
VAYRIGFSVSGVTESNYSQVAEFIVRRLLRLQDFYRESLETTLKDPKYIYFYPGITDEEIASAPCTITPVDFPGSFYMNIHDFRLECPFDYTIQNGFSYKMVYPGQYVVSSSPLCIEILDKEFVSRKLLARPKFLDRPTFSILLQENGFALLQENAKYILLP